MKIEEKINLAKYTTFKIGGNAQFFCIVKSEDDLLEAVKSAKSKSLPILVLGGGSNMLVSDEGYKGLVIKMEILGLGMTDSSMSAGAGELWDNLVERSVHWGFYGLENLSAIPGTVGAAPIQNIGAYGSEAAQTIEAVRVLDTTTMEFIVLSNEQCKFGYRDSIFKKEKGRYIITAVTFRLSKTGILHTDYKDVSEYFFNKKIANPTLRQLRDAIVEIRASKLPDWSKWGTAGSFFKNPTIPAAQYEELKKKYHDLPGYPEDDGSVKVSLGWILDKICDARGFSIGNVGTYGKQALVLVAQSGATAKEVMALSQELKKRVKDKTGITIEAEVEWVC
jgi:UDP-N-acetylmuramate dehydrogenase